jgi:hypothetical protein
VEVGDVLVVTRNAAAAAGEARLCGVIDGILVKIRAGLLLVSRAWMTRVPSCVACHRRLLRGYIGWVA